MMFNPWKRKVKREDKASQILASVESNPRGDNLLKHIIKEYRADDPQYESTTKREDFNVTDLDCSGIVKIENTLFCDIDENFETKIPVIRNELNDSTDSTDSLANNKDSIAGKQYDYEQNNDNNHVDKRNVDNVRVLDKNLYKINGNHNCGKGSSQKSGSQSNKKGVFKNVIRDNKLQRSQKWTRSSEDSFEQELALAIKQSLKDSQSTDQLNEYKAGNSFSMDCDEKVNYDGKLKLTYRTQCIDNYCSLCEEMYLGYSLLDLPQISNKELKGFDCMPKKHVDISWNHTWSGYKLLCSKYRKNQVIDLWGPKEVVLFELTIFRIGKEFHKLQKLIPTKTVGEIVDFYYVWKKTKRYHLWKIVRNLTFESLETDEIRNNLFQKTCSNTDVSNAEVNSKDVTSNSIGSSIASVGSASGKKSRVDKFKPKVQK